MQRRTEIGSSEKSIKKAAGPDPQITGSPVLSRKARQGEPPTKGNREGRALRGLGRRNDLVKGLHLGRTTHPHDDYWFSSILIREWSYLPISPTLKERRKAVCCEKPWVRHTDDCGNLKPVADPTPVIIEFAARPCRVRCQEQRDGGKYRALPAISRSD
jgi:hypothetical protein